MNGYGERISEKIFEALNICGFSEDKMKFTAQKVHSCREKFDRELVIFKFQSAEFKDITDYSGNNPDMI